MCTPRRRRNFVLYFQYTYTNINVCLFAYIFLSRILQEGTVRVVYAYHTDDPTSEKDLPQHSVRGAGSLVLLNILTSIPSVPKNTSYFELRQNDVSITLKINPPITMLHWIKITLHVIHVTNSELKTCNFFVSNFNFKFQAYELTQGTKYFCFMLRRKTENANVRSTSLYSVYYPAKLYFCTK